MKQEPGVWVRTRLGLIDPTKRLDLTESVTGSQRGELSRGDTRSHWCVQGTMDVLGETGGWEIS